MWYIQIHITKKEVSDLYNINHSTLRSQLNGTTVGIRTADTIGTTDNGLYKTSIEIRVYN